MSSSRKKVSRPAKSRPAPRGTLGPRVLDTEAAEQVKGGGGSRTATQGSSKPVARYYLENAWPSK